MATGRLRVAAGQTLDPDGWGNPIGDQTVQCFASAADRDTQYPTPHRGSLAYLEDSDSLVVYKTGGWVPLNAPSAWTTLPINTGWLAQSVALTPQYRTELGGLVRMRGSVKRSSGNFTNNDVPIILPAAILNKREYNFACACDYTPNTIRVSLKTSGNLTILIGETYGATQFFLDQIVYDYTQA